MLINNFTEFIVNYKIMKQYYRKFNKTKTKFLLENGFTPIGTDEKNNSYFYRDEKIENFIEENKEFFKSKGGRKCNL